MKIHKFNIEKYDFRSFIENFFETKELENIYDPDLKFKNPYDCLNTKYHQIYGSKIISDKGFLKLYNKFIKEYISKIFDFKILFERAPQIRIHQKNNISVFDYHIDSTYLTPDDVYNVYKHEINFWIPLTKAYDTNSLWIESEHGKKDYSPVTLEYGEMLEFGGANLYHGTEVNKTNQTRVSFDFRILPEKLFFDFINIKKNKENKDLIQHLVNYYSKVV